MLQSVVSQWIVLFTFYVYVYNVGPQATNLLAVNRKLAELPQLQARQKICLSETKKHYCVLLFHFAI